MLATADANKIPVGGGDNLPPSPPAGCTSLGATFAAGASTELRKWFYAAFGRAEAVRRHYATALLLSGFTRTNASARPGQALDCYWRGSIVVRVQTTAQTQERLFREFPEVARRGSGVIFSLEISSRLLH